MTIRPLHAVADPHYRPNMDVPTGTWTGPRGIQYTVTHKGDQTWEGRVYWSRRSRQPTRTAIYTSADEALRRIEGMERQGYLHSPHPRPEHTGAAYDSTATWIVLALGIVAGLVILFVAVT